MAEYIDKETTAYRLLKNGVKRKIVETAVLNVPASDVRENVKGKWERHGGYYHCSQCGARYAWGGNFCQNCGADMRGEKDD